MTQRVYGTEVLDYWLQTRMADVHTAMPAKILSYDAAAQTVDVRPQIKRYLFDDEGERTAEALPDLYGIPVAFPRGGGFHVTFPLAVDDYVLVVFAEEPTISWRDKAREVEPGLFDRHGLNGAFAMPCGYPDKDKLSSTPSTTDLVVASDDGASAVVVKPGGEVLLGDASAANYVALANLVKSELDAIKADFDSFKTTYDAHTHAGVTTGPGSTATPTTPWVAGPHTPGSVAASKTKAT